MFHQSSEPLEETKSSVVRTGFFVINFAGGILLLAAAIIAIVESYAGMGSPFALIGGVMLLGPCAAFIVAEWVAFYRNNRRVERVLGWMMFGLAAFVAFGVITNVGEALLTASPDQSAPLLEFMVCFVAIGTTISLYFGFCGLFRVRGVRKKRGEDRRDCRT